MGKHGGSAEGGRAQNYPSPLACCSACLLLLAARLALGLLLGLPLASCCSACLLLLAARLASCCLAYCLPLGLP
uniref:hypothetical protein n=1 Tax=Prevotella sp. TaxID=59823 RepID=UPI004025149A